VLATQFISSQDAAGNALFYTVYTSKIVYK